jgi:hypothetical protein
LKKAKEIYVNIENIRKCDFKELTTDQKYSVLMILVKYLLPVINQNNIESDILKQTLQNVKMRYHFRKKPSQEVNIPNGSISQNNSINQYESKTFTNNKSNINVGNNDDLFNKIIKLKFPRVKTQTNFNFNSITTKVPTVRNFTILNS